MSLQATRPGHTIINISINDQHYKLEQSAATGAELISLAGIPVGNQLFLDVPGKGDDEPIAPDTELTLRSGMKFYDVPAGNLG